MHTNHRRSVSRDPFPRGKGRLVPSRVKRPYQRLKWAQFRALERRRMSHGDWDDLLTKMPKNVLRDLW